MTALTTGEYRTLITRALEIPVDADTAGPNLQRLFTPTSHRLALDPDVTVVRGARGTGKTFWAKALTDPQLRDVAAASYMMPRLRRLTVTTGYAQGGSDTAPYPGKRSIARLMDSGIAPEDFWSAVVLSALGVPQVMRTEDWAERIRWTRENPDAYERALRTADRETRESGLTRVLLFDTLDHLHSDRQQADALVAGLFHVALELRLTTSALRAKIFVRPDMYRSAPKDFADASKLGANAADLTWSRENLYGLLFHQLGNHACPEAAKFRQNTGTWREEHDGRFIAPVDVIADESRQEEVFTTLAGPYMGTDRRKGHTYTWVPNHLQDGNGEVSPRTWLLALHKAAEITSTRYAGRPYPLHFEAIREGLHDASEARVDELGDDIGWAAEAIAQLEGGQVPMEQSVVHAYWRQGGLEAKLRARRESDGGSGPREPANPFALVDELHDLGVLHKRASGAVDLPDVYRLAFNIGRKGGVSRKPGR